MNRAPNPTAGRSAMSGRETERIVPGTPRWDAHYLEHIQRYEFAAERMRPGARVLDAGCGCGYGSAFLADHGAAMVVAVDISAEALATARRHFDRPSITWVAEDCHTLATAEAHAPFDLICALENLEHLMEPERFLGRISQLLRPEGTFIVSTPNREGVNRLRGLRSDASTPNPFHSREFSEEALRTMLLNHFEEVALAGQTFDPADRLAYEPALTALWSNPAMRFGRWLQRVVRGRPIVERVEDLLPPRRYRILSEKSDTTLAVTLIARCRGPRKGSPTW